MENDNRQKEEVDLLALILKSASGIWKIFTMFGKGIIYSLAFLIRNWKPLLISVVLGLALSFVLKYASTKIYKSDLVLRTNAVPAEEMLSYINKLNFFCTERNYDALAASLALPVSSARKIKEIGAYWIIDRNKDNTPDYVDYGNTHDIYDTLDLRMNDRVNIQVKTLNPGDLPVIKTGIIRYIDSDTLLKQKNRVRNEQVTTLLARIEYDIIQLDSLQKVKYFEETRNRIPGSGGQFVFLQEQRTQLVYTDIYDLYTRKQRYESELRLYSDIVTIISDFAVPIRPYIRIRTYAYILVPSFFLITVLFLLAGKLTELIKKLGSI